MRELRDRPHVLVADDEPNVRKVLGALLDQAGYTVTAAATGEEALALVRAQDPDVVISDLKMPGMDGLALLREIRARFPEVPVLLLTAHGTVEVAVEAMKRGAYDFLTKPFDRDRVLEVVAKAIGQAESSRREFQGPLADDEPTGIIGASGLMEELRRRVERVAPAPTTVLITGETGTGKELVAEALHRLSPRRGGPLVRINCGALPENLVEAELFGHERGAFTGAEKARPGRFELADGGTLFLDEIGELPLAAQVKLLRVLQDGLIDRVGASQPRRTDVRLITATHRQLGDLVGVGQFRQDLYFRLNVVEIRVPPLRDRIADLPLLVDFFLGKHARRLGRPIPSVSSAALALLAGHPWPGNVRELENAIERALLLGDGACLEAADFSPTATADVSLPAVADCGPGSIARPGASGDPVAPTATGIKSASRAITQEAQRRLIRAALEASDGNVTHTAARLGLSRRGLQIKMKEFGLRTSR